MTDLADRNAVMAALSAADRAWPDRAPQRITAAIVGTTALAWHGMVAPGHAAAALEIVSDESYKVPSQLRDVRIAKRYGRAVSRMMADGWEARCDGIRTEPAGHLRLSVLSPADAVCMALWSLDGAGRNATVRNLRAASQAGRIPWDELYRLLDDPGLAERLGLERMADVRGVLGTLRCEPQEEGADNAPSPTGGTVSEHVRRGPERDGRTVRTR